MNYYMHESGKLWQNEIPTDTPIALALGCFDGVHIGHQALIKEVLKDGLIPAIMTFSEPLTIPYIEKIEDRIKLCAGFGVKYAICEDFERFKNMSCSDFVSHLANTLYLKKVVCGEDFHFGRDRAGDASTLISECAKHGIDVTVVPNVMCEVDGVKQKVSSSLIRFLISEGRTDVAATLLGRQFAISGVVVSGNNLGRTIQVPTLNQRLEKSRIVPKNGVYDTVCVVNGQEYPSITNIGTRPTVLSGSHDKNCETHIIGQKLDLYGEIASVRFYDYIREETKFGSLEELRSQIAKDIQHSSNFFEAHKS